MKFEKHQKKNQVHRSYILKVIASQSLVKTLFLNKTEKENGSGEIRFREKKTYFRGFTFSLN